MCLHLQQRHDLPECMCVYMSCEMVIKVSEYEVKSAHWTLSRLEVTKATSVSHEISNHSSCLSIQVRSQRVECQHAMDLIPGIRKITIKIRIKILRTKDTACLFVFRRCIHAWLLDGLVMFYKFINLDNTIILWSIKWQCLLLFCHWHFI